MRTTTAIALARSFSLRRRSTFRPSTGDDYFVGETVPRERPQGRLDVVRAVLDEEDFDFSRGWHELGVGLPMTAHEILGNGRPYRQSTKTWRAADARRLQSLARRALE